MVDMESDKKWELLEIEVVGESIHSETESIHPESESIHPESESIHESIRDKWVGATEAYKRCGLTKSSFQRAISHLVGVRGCRVDSIRSGDAKNTRYSEWAIELIKAYKSGDEELMQQLLLSNSSVIPRCSALALPSHVATLDQKIALLQQASNTNSSSIADRIKSKLSQIALCNQASQQRNESLDNAELLAAENRGIEQALAIFSTEEAAKENALAHLRALKISGK